MFKSLKTKLLLPLLLIGSLAGCGGVDAKIVGAGPLPILPEPAPLNFNVDETATLEKWHAEDGKLFKKLQSQTHAYRETIRSYNKQARATNKKKLEIMGFDDKAIKETLDENVDPRK